MPVGKHEQSEEWSEESLDNSDSQETHLDKRTGEFQEGEHCTKGETMSDGSEGEQPVQTDETKDLLEAGRYVQAFEETSRCL